MIRWNLTNENLSLLDDVRTIEVGMLDLYCSGVKEDGFKRIIRFVKEHGTLLHALVVSTGWFSGKEDLTHFDFATSCPHLQTLDIRNVIINGSIFAHPSLEVLTLLNAGYMGPREITIGDGLSERDGHQLKEVGVMDCLFPVDTLAVGPAAQLKEFRYYHDEDYAEPDSSPDDFVFKECPQLEEITIHACAGWNILIKGVLPRLERISLDATQYCSYQCKIEDVDGQQRARYSRMLEQDDE